MGAVLVRSAIHDAFMQGPEYAIELSHGYTYSGHSLACAAGLATLEVHRDDELFRRSAALAPYWEDAVHSLKGLPHVIDLRNLGLLAGIELEPGAGKGSVTRLRRVPEMLRERRPGLSNREHHRLITAAHYREARDRPAFFDHHGGVEDSRLSKENLAKRVQEMGPERKPQANNI